MGTNFLSKDEEEDSNAVKVFIKNVQYYGMLNIGNRPTISDLKHVIEVHLFNFSSNIYNEEIKVGDKISIPGEAISGAIKKLWKQGIIGDIQIIATKIQGNKVFLTIKLSERARLSKFIIKGLGKSHTTEINEKINFLAFSVFCFFNNIYSKF